MTFSVAEKFVSINGEGTRAGQLAVFIRFTGCNLQCSYCDTQWASEPDCPAQQMTGEEILSYILDTGVTNVTLTGGEPLLRPGMEALLLLLGQAGLYVEIETNGSVPLERFCSGSFRPSFTMDYKLPSSGMEGQMCRANFALLTRQDTVKFVSGSLADLDRAGEIMEEYGLIGKCAVYLSPVFGQIQPSEMVDWMKERRLNGVNLQIQMHKVIWPPEQRGV